MVVVGMDLGQAADWEKSAVVPTRSNGIRVTTDLRAAKQTKKKSNIQMLMMVMVQSFSRVKDNRTGREGSQWADLVEGNGSGPCAAWDEQYAIAYAYLAWEGGGDSMQMITNGERWTLAWTSCTTGYNLYLCMYSHSSWMWQGNGVFLKRALMQ
eukprot:10262106-Ditylum_brightwellii.AAC.1